MAVNDDLADDIILRSIRNLRAGNGVWRQLLPILQQVEEDLLERLSAGAPRTTSSRRARALLQIVRKVIKDGAEAFNKELQASGGTLAAAEEAATVRSFGARVPVEVAWVRPAARLLEAVALTPFEGATLGAHLDNWSEQAIFRVQTELRTAIIEGEGIEKMQRRLRKVMNIKIKDARSLARTYTMHVTSEARRVLYLENSEYLSGEQWVATLDTRTCLRCGALDGKIFPVGKGTRTPLHFQCRCLRIPIVKGAAALERQGVISTRAARDAEGLTGEVPADMDFSAWLARQSESRQKMVLGAKRFKLHKEGMSFSRFVDDENDIIPLSEL